jgi:hypothetical protein
MDDQLKAQLVSVLSSLADSMKNGAALAQEQLPILIQEKILYGRIAETLLFVVLLGITYTLVRVAMRLRKEIGPHEDEILVVLAWFGATLFAVGCLIQASFMISVWVSPHVYILEWLAGMVKGN